MRWGRSMSGYIYPETRINPGFDTPYKYGYNLLSLSYLGRSGPVNSLLRPQQLKIKRLFIRVLFGQKRTKGIHRRNYCIYRQKQDEKFGRFTGLHYFCRTKLPFSRRITWFILLYLAFYWRLVWSYIFCLPGRVKTMGAREMIIISLEDSCSDGVQGFSENFTNKTYRVPATGTFHTTGSSAFS